MHETLHLKVVENAENYKYLSNTIGKDGEMGTGKQYLCSVEQNATDRNKQDFLLFNNTEI